MNRQERREKEKQQKNLATQQAERAIRLVAARHGQSVAHVRQHMKLAMLSGLVREEAKTKAAWQQIPKAGEVHTPEELVAHLAQQVAEGRR